MFSVVNSDCLWSFFIASISLRLISDTQMEIIENPFFSPLHFDLTNLSAKEKGPTIFQIQFILAFLSLCK